MAAVNSPGTLFNMLKKAKAAYQQKKPDAASEPEIRHKKIVEDLKRLREFARKELSGADLEKPFRERKKALLKKLKEHYQKLKKAKDKDENKDRLPRYLKILGTITLKVRGLEYRTLEDGENANPDIDRLPDEDLSVLDSADEEAWLEDPAPAATAPPPPAPPPPKPPPAPEKKPSAAPRPADPAERSFQAKLRTVMPAYQRLVQALPDRKAAFEPLVAAVTAAGRTGQFARGLAALDQLEAALKDAIRAAAAAPAGPPADADAARSKEQENHFKERLRALGGPLAKALQDARKSDPTRAEQLEDLQARAFDLARAKQYEEGLEVLDELAAVLNGVKPAPADNAAARFKARLQRLSGEYARAAAAADLTRATQLTELFAGAARAARAGEYDKALQTLDELEAAFKAALRSAAAAQEVKKATGGNNVAFVKSKLAWDRGRKDAATALRAYQVSILTDPDVQADPRYNEIKRIVIGLNKALAHFDGSINDALDAAANATNEADKQKAVREALSQVARYRARLEGNPALKVMEQGAFGSAGVYQRLAGALDELSRHLSR
jgi:hypothetical protein